MRIIIAAEWLCRFNRAIFFLMLITIFGSTVVYSQTEIYKNLKENVINFHGVESKNIDLDLLDCIPIGLFIPTGKNKLGNEILQGVKLAIDEENERRGFEEKKFCIKRRWSEDPWGSGSKDVIDLIYKDHALCIIAYKNGASHIALQIAAKINISVLSPVTTDPSLTMTGVPWIFRLPPDDKKQAKILYRDGIKKRSLKRLGVISEIEHDIRIAANEIIKVLKHNKNAPVFHLNIANVKNDVKILAKRIKNYDPDGLILYLSKTKLFLLLSKFQKWEMKIPVFTAWIPDLKNTELNKEYLFPIYFIEPFPLDDNYLENTINKKYFNKYKTQMTYSAIYSYDITKMLISAIKKYGLSRSRIRKGLRDISGYRGISGKIIWDNSGSNKTYPKLTLNKN